MPALILECIHDHHLRCRCLRTAMLLLYAAVVLVGVVVGRGGVVVMVIVIWRWGYLFGACCLFGSWCVDGSVLWMVCCVGRVFRTQHFQLSLLT